MSSPPPACSPGSWDVDDEDEHATNAPQPKSAMARRGKLMVSPRPDVLDDGPTRAYSAEGPPSRAVPKLSLFVMADAAFAVEGWRCVPRRGISQFSQSLHLSAKIR